MYCNARVFHFDPSESVPMRMLDESWNEFIIGVCQGKPRSPNQGATNCVKLDRIFARYLEKCMTIVQVKFFRERDVRSEILQVFLLWVLGMSCALYHHHQSTHKFRIAFHRRYGACARGSEKVRGSR